MPRVTDVNGVTYALEGEDLTKALATGQVRLAEAANVATKYGIDKRIGPDTDVAILRNEGVTTFEGADVGRDRRESAYREDKYGSQNVRAGLEGLASGLTLGASDVALDALGADTKERAEYNPNIRMAGELTGVLGASVVPGLGAGKLGQLLAKTPAGLVSAKSAALGASIGGVKGMAVGAAVEGAAYGLGQTASQLLITDEPLSAEAVWAELGKNAAFGAGAGAAGGAILGGLGKGYKALKAARASAPVVDLASADGKQVAKNIADALNEVEVVADLAAAMPAPVAPAVPSPAAVTARQAVDDFRAPLVGRAGKAAPPTRTPPPADILPVNAADSVPVAQAPPAPSPAAAKPDFASQFDEVYDQLRQSKPFDMVELSELRAKFPDLSGDQFNKELRELRKGRRYLLEGFEGRHGTLSEADKAAAITEDGRQFIYAQRAADYKPSPKPAAPADKPFFAKAASDAANATPGWLGGSKVFIGDAYDTYKATHGGDITLDEFKGLLRAANQAGDITLTRADLPDVMDPAKVSRSSIVDDIGELNFIETGRGFDAPATSGADDLAGRVESAFDELDAAGDNYVSIPKLRQKLADVPRDQLDAAINDLRSKKVFTADSAEGRHGAPDLKDGLRDGRDTLMFLARRAPRSEPPPRAPVVVADEVVPPAGVDPAVPDPTPTPSAPPALDAPVAPAPPSALGEFKAARERVQMLLGTSGSLQASHVTRLLKQPPDVSAPVFEAIDTYMDAAQKFATEVGDPRALQQLDTARKAIADAASVATNGVDRVKLGEVAAALGLVGVGETVDGPAGDLAGIAGAGMLVKAGGPHVARKGRSFLGHVARGATRSVGGRAVNKTIRGTGVVRDALGYQVGARGMGALFDTIVGQRAIAGVTANGTGRITAAFEGAGKGAAKAIAAGQLSAMTLIRSARFDYGQRDPKQAKSDLQGAYRDRLEELAVVASNPMAAQQAAHDNLAEVRKVAPYVADELEMLAVAVPQFLYDKAPKDPGTMTRMGQSTWRPPEYEIRQWGEYVKGALAPLETLEGAMRGRITPQAAESVRTLFPNLFQKAQVALIDTMQQDPKRFDLQTRTRLSVLFDVPLDSTMQPEFRSFIADQNAMRAAEAQQPKPGGSGSTSKPAPLTGAQQLLE